MTDQALVSKYVEFDAGHRVPSHASKCRNPHGHRYRVVAHVAGPILEPTGASDDGMVVDFGTIKQLLTEHVHDVYDHAFVVWEHDPSMIAALAVGSDQDGTEWRVVVVPFVPTAENLAQHTYDVLATHMPAPLRLHHVDIYETPTSVASYYGGTV